MLEIATSMLSYSHLNCVSLILQDDFENERSAIDSSMNVIIMKISKLYD
jgi:hypothetical protein